MAQQFDYPKTETQLREIQDALYQHSKEVYEAGDRPAFKGLLEIMSAESTIITAIHNIKGNHGSETPGVDSKTMRKDYLQKPFPWVVADIQRAFKYFEPQQIRRVYIDKPGKSEKRPLGIPAIRDRIVQECMRISQEKTLITDIRKKYIKFLGYEFKMVRGKSRRGYIPRTIPDRERLKRRADKIAEDIKKIPGNYSREQMVGAINRINSQIRGIIQYYQCCTWVNIAMQKHSRKLQLAARRRLKQYNGKWIPANQTRNLPRVHQQYKQKIPSIKYRDIYVGFTALTFCRWERTPPKNQAETPYTDTGRQLYFERTKKKKMQARLDEMYSDRSARAISYGKWGKFNNFEFIMNRAYALNRDKLRCRVCGGWLIANTPWAHRINPYLPLDKVNRVNNLISLHKKCFIAVNNPNQDISEFDVKAQKKIVGYRDKLVISHTRNK